MGRITVNSNPLNQNDDIEGSPQPPPQNPLPSCLPPPPPQYQNQIPVRYPPTYHLNHQCTVGSNNGMMDQCPVNTELENWKTGLFDCMDNPSNAAMTLFLPCVTFGQIAEIVDQGHTSFCSGLPCLISNPYRTKLRIQYKLVESPASDSLLHLFCDCCALCQEYRELQLRGIDPSIGWSGNEAKILRITQQCAVMPPRRQTMSC